MTDAAPRPPSTRGRGSGRGGRGGSRGAFRQRERQTNGDQHKDTTAMDDIADQGELGDMKKQYSSQLSTLKELFQDWTDVDLLFALRETDGDLDRTIEHITEGHVSQFSDVKKTKDRVKVRSKDQTTAADSSSSYSRPARGRGGQDGTRGGRGRPDRTRGGSRGGRGGQSTNGGRSTPGATSTAPAEGQDWSTQATDGDEKTAWDTTEPDASTAGQWGSVVASKATPAAAAEGAKSSLIPEGGPKKTWAQMFAKPAPVPTPSKSAVQSTPTVEPPSSDTEPAPEPTIPEQEEVSVPPSIDEAASSEDFEIVDPPSINMEESAIELAPSKDQLTEDNVEHLPDASQPPPTGTAASTLDSASRGPDSATPSVVGQSSQPVPIGRPGMGGYATTAYKATAPGGRSASFTRRLFEQHEAVVLPGNHAVDKVGVQFGQMGLNGDGEDVDEEREDAETRTQPPQHSPQGQPRASLPPAPRQSAPPVEAAQEPIAVPKPAQGLPPTSQQQPQTQQSPEEAAISQVASHHVSQAEQPFSQFGRYGQTSAAMESTIPSQKLYDPFGQQQSQSPFSGYTSHSQAPSQTSQAQAQAQSHLGAFSSAPSEYSSYYTSDQQRNAYQNYYGSGYGQQSTPAQQDGAVTQQRTGSAFGSGSADSGIASSQAQQIPMRYGDSQHSGHSTPNPTVGSQQQQGGAQPQHTQHMHQQPHGQGQHGSGYPYGAQAHAYYNRMDPYYAAYMNQFGYNQGGFGGGGFGKGGYSGPHHGYGMNPQTGYDQHSSSPANIGGFGQSSMRGHDTGVGTGLGDFARSGSTQPSHSHQPTSGVSAFAGMGDMFGRSGGAFPGQSQGYGQQSGAQATGAEDSLKPFGDSKSTTGPSPAGLGQPGRPGSATNPAGQATGSGLPPPQSQQHGFGGYGGHMNQMQSGQGSQYGGLGGLSGHQGGGQGHQGGSYGYGGGFNNNYSYGRGGWGGSYGH